jgi:hypothetical protein
MYDDLRGFDCSEYVAEGVANAMSDCPVAILKWRDYFPSVIHLQSTFIICKHSNPPQDFSVTFRTPINAT